MKVLIYSDLHCSVNSSILPLYPKSDNCSEEEKKFTTRLRMIIQTGKWIASLAAEQNVDIIINGGDTFDSTLVKSEELEAISKFFEPFESLKIPHIILVGNHEKVNNDFNASEIFKRFSPYIQVISNPQRINNEISVIPYMDSKNISAAMLEPLRNTLCVSHIDIQGSCLRDSYILDSGVNPELLAEYFTFTANGHLHTAEHLETSQNSVWNIGGVSSISFVDNQNYIPSVVIYDTEKTSFIRYKNPHSILFKRVTIHTLKDLAVIISKFDPNRNYALAVKYTNYKQKDSILKLLEKQKNILAFKCTNDYVQDGKDKTSTAISFDNIHVQDQFTEFLDTIDLPYEKSEYKNILNLLT